VSSAPVAALVQRMLTVSDNDLAEALGRAIAVHAGEPATFSGAARAIRDQLPALGVPVGGVRLYDASGLSRLDQVTPAALVGLLRVAQDRPELQPVLAGLPVAGLTGTVADRYRSRPTHRAAGLVRAKTGTLAGVSALAGQLVDADGRLLVFAFLTDHAPTPELAEEALDRLATRLVRCGCREAA
jgi:D-alanyl-D-alanine carboxypeptidase/D-alanyl-D-alanine-endopeptidase (penicillin-binding protein 4)